MAIVSSTFQLGNLQVDGRRYVTEQHTDSVGVVHEVEYLAPVGADYQAIATERGARIAEQLAELEFNELVGA